MPSRAEGEWHATARGKKGERPNAMQCKAKKVPGRPGSRTHGGEGGPSFYVRRFFSRPIPRSPPVSFFFSPSSSSRVDVREAAAGKNYRACPAASRAVKTREREAAADRREHQGKGAEECLFLTRTCRCSSDGQSARRRLCARSSRSSLVPVLAQTCSADPREAGRVHGILAWIWACMRRLRLAAMLRVASRTESSFVGAKCMFGAGAGVVSSLWVGGPAAPRRRRRRHRLRSVSVCPDLGSFWRREL